MTVLERRDKHPRAAIVLGAGYPDRRRDAGAAVPQEPRAIPCVRPHPGFAPNKLHTPVATRSQPRSPEVREVSA
jgi:hypothetical protein